ncbi:BTAD domain-containing putative transcriptional regulator [Micromonospora sp. NPDC049051]|uniref:BTAD domain-containing putative transcriptional regulator n=1 Tax=Micromonospora sp. NPDC049051 TaxID=3364264 RepID=UPI00371DD0B2
MRSRSAAIAASITSLTFTAAICAWLDAADIWPAPRLPARAAVRQWIQQPLTPEFVITLVQGAAVVLWLLLATSMLTRAYARLAHTLRWLPALRLPGPLQGLTAALLGATAVSSAAAATPAAAAPAAGTSHDTDQHTTRPSTTSLPSLEVNADRTLTLMAAGREYTYTVERGDTLSEIAEQWLGDASRWPDIFALNRGTRFADVGGTLRNPNVIHPGWTLDLPADATPPPRHRPRPKPSTPTPPEVGKKAPARDITPPAEPTAPSKPHAPAPSDTTTAAPDGGSTAAPTPSNPADDVTASQSSASQPSTGRTRGISLPSGSWVDVGLALAIAAAVALVWIHRQRRYVPRIPSPLPRHEDPDLAPMPRVVGQIRRGLRHATARPHTTGRGIPCDADDDLNDQSPTHAGSGSDDVHAEGVTNANDDRHHNSPDGPASRSLPVAPALTHPLSAVWPPAGLGLTGPGAEAAARGFLVAALAAGHTDQPDARAQVVMPSATAATLLDTDTVTLVSTPRLTITGNLDDALQLLEAQALHRTRLLYQHEVDTVTDLRAADPGEEPLAPVMLLADATERHQRARIAAALAQGQRLDIHGVLLGSWPEGNTIDVAADGATTPGDGDARHGHHPADLGRLTVLNPTETADLITTLAESHTGQRPAPAPDATPAPPQPAPDYSSGTPEPANLTRTATKTEEPGENSPTDAGCQGEDRDSHDPNAVATTTGIEAGHHHKETANRSVDVDLADTSIHHNGQPSALAEQAPPRKPQRGRVEVNVLGAPALVDYDPGRSLRAKSLELLVYLAVRDGSASTEAILDDLLPEAPASKALHRLHTYVSDLRAVLRHNAGPGTYLTHHNHRYQLNADRFDIDLWRMRAAIRAADTATAGPERIAALRRAVDTYRPLAEDCDYEWLEPHRHAVRQEAFDAAVALLDELAGQPADQAAVLDTALHQHPYAETLYQTAMRVHAQLGHPDTVHALHRTLTRRLAEIDADPHHDTVTLAARLLTEQGQRKSTGRARQLPNEPGPIA